MSNFINHPVFKLLLTLSIFTYLGVTLNVNSLYQQFIEIEKIYFLSAIIIFLPNTALFIYKWHLIINKFSKGNFVNLYIILSKAIAFSELLQSSLVIDAVKIFYLKKLKKFTRISLLLNDKIITLITKILYLIITFFLLLIFIQNYELTKFIQKYSLKLSLFLTIGVFLLFFIIRQFFSYYKKYFSSKVIPRKKIFFIEILRNILITSIYFIGFIQFFDVKTTLIFAVISPLIELTLRFQIFSSIGFRELIILTLGSQIGFDQSVLLPSIFITFVTFFTSINNYLISLLYYRHKELKKTKNCELLIYKKNNDYKGTEDFYEQLKFLTKKVKGSVISNNFNFNAKRVIIVENFINPIEFLKIIFFLIFFKGQKYLLHTEFVTVTRNIYSYNDFNKEVKSGIFLSLLNYLRIRSKKLFSYKLTQKDKREVFLTYFQLRFFTTKIISYFFDYIILAHPNMNYTKLNFKNNKVKIFPYFFRKIDKKIFNKKNYYIDFSGYLTNFRLEKLNNLKFNKKIFNDAKITKIINKKKLGYFIKSKSDKKNLIFSLHIEKEKSWPYSSPARYFNSIKKNEVPIVFKKFNDKYAKLTFDKKILLVKSKIKLKTLIKKINENIEYHNSFYEKDVKKLINF